MARSLAKYRSKRDFSRTPEPRHSGSSKGRPRFVVHEHHARRLHWDLRLEHDGVLLSWAIPNGIPEDPKHNRKAIQVEDHPISYLEFQGEIPRGSYGAGEVRIWDSGFYECEKLRSDELIVVFDGQRLQGRYALFRAGEQNDWMIHRMDPPEHPREEFPTRMAPMLASAGSLPRQEDRWGYEIKWDGIRALLYWQPGRLRLQARTGTDLTARYPEVRAIGEQLGSHEALLDGEIVAFDDEGNPSFERLQSRMHLTSASAVRRKVSSDPVTYVIFDLLHLDGQPIAGSSYRERRVLLERLELEGPAWQTPAYHQGDAVQLLQLTAQRRLEGLIAKRLESAYQPGQRTRDWLKIKNSLRQEFVIGGWLEGLGPGGLGALLVGYHDHDSGLLRYAGRVGSGFAEQGTRTLMGQLEGLARDDSPFCNRVAARKAHYVEPQLVAEVQFGGWTNQRILRHSVFKGLRTDKPSTEVFKELSAEPERHTDESKPVPDDYEVIREGDAYSEIRVQGRTLKLSNRSKVLYPDSATTKGELIDYYRAVSPVLLEHLAERPLTLKRYPNGVQGKSFYEKRCPTHRPDWIRTASIVSERQGESIDYCLVNDLPSLLWVANLATIELHTSLSLASELGRPTAVVFDLDPGAPAGIRECCKVALWIAELFQTLGLQTVVKTSGQKGLQVYLPVDAGAEYHQTKPFAHAVARLLEQEHPQLVVSRMSVKLRAGKVLIDWNQNDPHKTTVCAYSLRASPEPRVSTPLDWEEVKRGARSKSQPALSATPAALLKRLERKGDLFAPALEPTQALPTLGVEPYQEPLAQSRHDLYELARELGIPGRSKMTAAQLREAIAETPLGG